ncbi:TonB-dependent receptor, partial [Arthrospira platensis SPKY1]|nr:TonB-dependent receptor [Arthrospira platensis SPKY1]
AAFRQTLGKWQGQFHLRQELVDGAFTPIAPSLGLERPLTNWLSLKARFSRNYRLPTFNDLYWQPGGNPDLLAESGWSQEATAAARIKIRRQQWQLSLTGFNRQ